MADSCIQGDTLAVKGGGKMQNYVAAALQYLRDPDNGPLQITSSSQQSSQNMVASLHKIISVVELIKREYPKTFPVEEAAVADQPQPLARVTRSKRKEKEEKESPYSASYPKGKQLPRRLWQYNRLLATLEEPADFPPSSADLREFSKKAKHEEPPQTVVLVAPAPSSAVLHVVSKIAADKVSQGNSTVTTQNSTNPPVNPETSILVPNSVSTQTDTSGNQVDANNTVDLANFSLSEPTNSAIQAHTLAMQTLVQSGRKRPPKHHNPEFTVFLSVRKLPPDAMQRRSGWTCQAPAKAAPERPRKRKRKGKTMGKDAENNTAMDVDAAGEQPDRIEAEASSEVDESMPEINLEDAE